MSSLPQQHALEDTDSYHRHLKSHHHLQKKAQRLEEQLESEFVAAARDQQLRQQQDAKMAHDKRLKKLKGAPGQSSVHGLMIDAGSTGSRLHVYEWEPRVLRSVSDIEQAVVGNKLSFPGTESRWTDRLRPGLASFAAHDNLEQAVAEYLQPLLDFAKVVLESKREHWGKYPVFLRGTAGLRLLETEDRARVMGVVRKLFHNDTFCPFAFEDEQARVLSGEEEAVYDWVGVNFLLGDLIDDSHGAGTVLEPRLTHGALDLGGASTQIGFYEPNEDIMSNLFKLQIGQAKHWNLYAHSFLFYGMNQAIERYNARLAAGKSSTERLIDGIYDPCRPGGAPKATVRTNIHFIDNDHGHDETWDYTGEYPSGNGAYQAVLINNGLGGDVEECFGHAQALLHLEKNSWCDFAHRGDCSFAGIYQPELPSQTNSPNFGEFVAFSNYFHIWNFLHLPGRATIAQLKNATEYVCSMSYEDLVVFNDGVIDETELDSYCFRSAYAYQLLRHGYGFQLEDTIRATKVIHGQKVGWALGAMLYEINTMPWEYVEAPEEFTTITSAHRHGLSSQFYALLLVALATIGGVIAILFRRHVRLGALRQFREEYEPIKNVQW